MLQAEFTPLEIDEDSLAFGAHQEVGHGGHFLGAMHTMERFRTCFYRPMLSSSDNYERWMRNGGLDTNARASKIYQAKLEEYVAPPLDDADPRRSSRSTSSAAAPSSATDRGPALQIHLGHLVNRAHPCRCNGRGVPVLSGVLAERRRSAVARRAVMPYAAAHPLTGTARQSTDGRDRSRHVSTLDGEAGGPTQRVLAQLLLRRPASPGSCPGLQQPAVLHPAVELEQHPSSGQARSVIPTSRPSRSVDDELDLGSRQPLAPVEVARPGLADGLAARRPRGEAPCRRCGRPGDGA